MIHLRRNIFTAKPLQLLSQPKCTFVNLSCENLIYSLRIPVVMSVAGELSARTLLHFWGLATAQDRGVASMPT